MRAQVRSVVASGLAAWLALPVSADVVGIVHGRVDVVQNDTGNSDVGVTLTKAGGSSSFSVLSGPGSGSSRGDYQVRFGTGSDQPAGVMISSPRENGRTETVLIDPDGTGPQPAGPVTGNYFATTHSARGGGGNYFLPVIATSSNAANGITGDGGQEVNLNVASAFFPYATYLGGNAYNSANNGPLDSFVGSSGINLGTQLVDNPANNGQYSLDLTGLTSFGVQATSQNGVLLAVGAKNEDNFALSRANADGTFSLFTKDNGADGASHENDPVGFVYLPAVQALADAGIAAGRILADASTIVGIGNFAVSAISNGQYLLQIAGQSDATGTLLISPEGGQSVNQDNYVSYEFDFLLGGWVVQSRDLPGAGLQSPISGGTTPQPAFSFAFIPDAAPAAVPEPSSFALLGLVGGVGLIARRFRRKGIAAE